MHTSMVVRSLRGATVALAFGFVLAACGGGSSTATPPATTTTTGRGRGGAAALAAFRTCMQSHGISLPANAGFGGFRGGGGAGGVGGGAGNTSGTRPTTTLPAGVTSQQWNTALQACASSIPRGGTVNSTALANYRNCLNAYLETHGGTTLPTNGAGAGFGGGGFGGGGDGASGDTTTTNPLMEAAQAHCVSLRPAFGRGSTTTSTTV